MCTRHFVVDFSIFLLVPVFSNLLLHPNHTVCKANMPEMITEDYISDVEEGIFIFLRFLFALSLLPCCFLYVLTFPIFSCSSFYKTLRRSRNLLYVVFNLL